MTKYKKVTPEIAAQLQAIVGAKRFFAGDAVKDDFSHDEMPIYGKYYPEVVCEAESTEEVSAILRVCYENDIPVTPRGAGTGLVGGCVPLCGGVVRSTDLRAGAAMVIAAMCAEGTTLIEDAHFIERGYEDIVGKLTALGASIRRVETFETPSVTEDAG